MYGLNENLGEHFFDGEHEHEDCDCSWCKQMIPAYSKLFKLLEENHFGWNNKEIKELVEQIKENHEFIHETLENIMDDIDELDENLGDN